MLLVHNLLQLLLFSPQGRVFPIYLFHQIEHKNTAQSQGGVLRTCLFRQDDGVSSLFSRFGKEEAVVSIENRVLRTLFFDYGTLSFQTLDWITKIHVYATTGQDYYAITRPITLKTVDGIIVVLD